MEPPERSEHRDPTAVSSREPTRIFSTTDVLERACALPEEHLVRIWRGSYDERSEDLIVVPQHPNYAGNFRAVNHSGPWRYLQNVPLVFYGPGHIQEQGHVEGDAGLVDVYGTMGQLAGVDLGSRSGRVLTEALEPAKSSPKLLVTIVWDGVGRNVLDQWSDRWPTLARLEREGTSYIDATVGSSPSITPATHATLGTGYFPRRHHVTGIKMTIDGEVVEAMNSYSAQEMDASTYAEDIDEAYDNASAVGMLGWSPWHLGMIGRGSAAPGGDADEVGFVGIDRHTITNDSFYVFPSEFEYLGGFDAHATRVDRSDGRADGKWLGHDLRVENENPAYVAFGADLVLAMLQNGSYGMDDVPDFFFTNFKMSDLIGHRYGMESKEMGEVIEAQDRALARIVEWLDREVGDYVIVLTADHGHTPAPEISGGWPMQQGEVTRDINSYFKVPKGETLIAETTGVGSFVNEQLLREMNLSLEEVATYLNGYTLRDNWRGSELPEGYEDRAKEHIFSATFPASQLPGIMSCKFGSPMPPGG